MPFNEMGMKAYYHEKCVFEARRAPNTPKTHESKHAEKGKKEARESPEIPKEVNSTHTHT